MLDVYGSTITGLGAYRPAHCVGNEELAQLTSVTPDWIVDRTGIQTRHHASPDEDIVTMSVEACGKALAMADVDTADVDLLILATSTRLQRIPGAAAQIASRLGIPSAGAFDVNAVCAGFTYSLANASNAVRLGDARNALVVGAERTSDLINKDTPDTYVIFGDGAGAAVVSRSERADIGPSVWGSDGGRHAVLETRIFDDGNEYVAMDGPLVYKWSTATMPKVARQACERAGVAMSDVAWFVPHQANRRIIDTLTRVLGFADDQVSRDVIHTGNTSAASVPLALTRLRESGKTTPGDLVLLLGFGAGLTYAGQIVRMP
ncbi:3-oxoacyl-[acyl-carrier-protein] synthase 3 protein 4 [Catellatospora methionotrophica]|uniref:3-oxoacyl-[acyl-carrier-protein] synthase 3 protein 4 n=1 Tax=Catellatospora methionotrophica TaxID=121620 RepID=A0A8J3PII5_9ACTN|nr:beta-ketoacyl-ACP synthase III [Catellatospora methionotrophica]GIG18976.1 3-oxoacyl-[acyl-carrier-protein] synthase 3 protein 4 [Catellatospora methionotrophica]